jgi:hypothetical protein
LYCADTYVCAAEHRGVGFCREVEQHAKGAQRDAEEVDYADAERPAQPQLWLPAYQPPADLQHEEPRWTKVVSVPGGIPLRRCPDRCDCATGR